MTFVKSGSETASEISETKPTSLSGEEAKSFYEEIASMPSENRTNNRSRTNERRRHRKRVSPTLSVDEARKQLFRGSQNGSLPQVESALASGSCSIRDVDAFAWTPLMCAAYGGHAHVVRYLLAFDGDGEVLRISDRRGRTAVDLARLGNRSDVVAILEDKEKEKETEETPSLDMDMDNSALSVVWCEDCEMDVKDSSHRRHRTTTLHQFSSRKDDLSTSASSSYYPHHRSTPAYKIMLNHGWTDDRGLGSDGSGRLQPVKTVLKRDRIGLGGPAGPARVTHFSSFDAGAVGDRRLQVSPVEHVTTMRDVVREKSREKQIEKRFRRLFHEHI